MQPQHRILCHYIQVHRSSYCTMIQTSLLSVAGTCVTAWWRVATYVAVYHSATVVIDEIVKTNYAVLIFSNFYPRDAMLAWVTGITQRVCLSVRPSVCLSVTRRYCVKKRKLASWFLHRLVAPRLLFFWRQISSPNSKGPPSGGLKEGWGEKFSDFLDLSVNISKTVADTAKVTISD